MSQNHEVRKFLTRLTQPSAEPVDAVELSDHAKVSNDDERAALYGFLPSARETIERAIGRSFLASTWEIAVDGPVHCLSFLRLGQCPVTSIQSFHYYTLDDVQQTFAGSNYVLDQEQGRVFLKNAALWPTDLRAYRSMVVSFTAGYSSAAAVPPPMKLALKMLASHYYENREAFLSQRPGEAASIAEIPAGVRQLLAPFNENLI